MVKSTRTSATSLLTAKIVDAEKRIATLEKRVADLEKRISLDEDEDSEQSFHGYFGDDDSDPVNPEPVILKLGRRPRISADKFASRRDEVVHFIELRWPALCSHFNAQTTIEGLLRALELASLGAEHNWPYRHLTEHVVVLWEFLQSGRYTGEPRQIAYAMAGVPELASRTSLDRGTNNPSILRITLPAFADHIRRHNPNCLKALIRTGTTPETLRLLRSCCEECRRLAAKPERVRRALQIGNVQGGYL